MSLLIFFPHAVTNASKQAVLYDRSYTPHSGSGIKASLAVAVFVIDMKACNLEKFLAG